MDDKELTQLNRTVNTAIQKLGKVQSSLEALRALTTRTDASDLMKLTQIEKIVSSLSDFKSFSPTLNHNLDDCLDDCESQISSTIQISSLEALTDDAIYALYYLAKNRGTYIRANPNSEIMDAINHISALRRTSENIASHTFLSWKLSWRRNRAKIEFKDGTMLLGHQLGVPKNLPEDAISADNVAQFCIGMNLAGKQLSFTLLRHLIAKRCAKILEHIVRKEKKLSKTISPANLLLTILIEWPSPNVKSPLQVFAAIEETYPGTIKSAEDANGNNALWFAVYLVNNCPDIASEIGNYFASCGCDLDKPFKAGFSWNTMVRLMSIIKRHEQDRANTP